MSVAMTGALPAGAEEFDDSVVEYSTLEEYVEYIIPRHLNAQSITFDGVLDYSEPIALYDFAANEVIGSTVFFMYDGEFVGSLEVYGSDGDYSSSFSTYITDDIINSYQNEEPIAIGYVDYSLLMYSSVDGYIHINGEENYDTPNSVPADLAQIVMTGIAETDYIVPYSVATVKLRGISHVDNSSTYDNGECWAAAVAMKLNYHLGLHLTADKIYEDLMEAGLETRALSAYEYYGYDATILAESLSIDEAFFILKDDSKPIIMIIKRTGATTSHAVVLYGIVIENNKSATFTIDDPNIGTTSFTINNDLDKKNDSIYYKQKTRIYTRWLSTRY